MKRLVLLSISLAVASLTPHGLMAVQVQGGSAAPEQREIIAQFLGERGALVEFLGLAHWTSAMLRDSLAVRAPDASIASASLAGTLTEKVGFPAAVAWRQSSGDSAVNMLVVVIEPEESARIRRRTFDGDTTTSLAPWPALVAFTRKRLDLLEDALEAPVYARIVGLGPAVPLEIRPDSTEVRRLWTVLSVHRSAEDMAMARRLLTSSPHVYDRLAAVAILSNFEHQDAAWHALVGAILDPDPTVRGLAAHALLAFKNQAPRRVDWRSAVDDLRAILDGSELSLLPQVLDIIVATGVRPELAGPLLRAAGLGVLMFASATRPDVRQSSYRFLRAVSGGQHRASVEEWRAWIWELGR